SASCCCSPWPPDMSRPADSCMPSGPTPKLLDLQASDRNLSPLLSFCSWARLRAWQQCSTPCSLRKSTRNPALGSNSKPSPRSLWVASRFLADAERFGARLLGYYCLRVLVRHWFTCTSKLIGNGQFRASLFCWRWWQTVCAAEGVEPMGADSKPEHPLWRSTLLRHETLLFAILV